MAIGNMTAREMLELIQRLPPDAPMRVCTGQSVGGEIVDNLHVYPVMNVAEGPIENGVQTYGVWFINPELDL
jgi:hypothetical protein